MALFNPIMSVLIQEHHPYAGNLNIEGTLGVKHRGTVHKLELD